MPMSDEATVDTEPVKAVEGAETEAESEPESVDPIISLSSNFCSNLFGTILGKKKICNHCKQNLLNSDLRLKEMEGEKKIYYHPECKTERTARIEKKSELHQDLMKYFEMKAELERRAELERLAKIEAARRSEIDRRREAERQAAEFERSRGSSKKGLMATLGDMLGCRNNRAVA